MAGDDRTRHCALCRRTVHSLSEMTAEEAAALLRESGEPVCVRFRRGADGAVVTRDGPRPAPPTRAQKALMAAALAGALVASDAALDNARDAFGPDPHPPWTDVTMGEMVVEPEWQDPALEKGLPLRLEPPPPPPPPAPW